MVIAQFKRARVNIDYHVDYDGHYYSVPHRLVRQEVDLRVTAATIEILHGQQRVATHPRRRTRLTKPPLRHITRVACRRTLQRVGDEMKLDDRYGQTINDALPLLRQVQLPQEHQTHGIDQVGHLAPAPIETALGRQTGK